eukprot:gene6692-2545_t
MACAGWRGRPNAKDTGSGTETRLYRSRCVNTPGEVVPIEAGSVEVSPKEAAPIDVVAKDATPKAVTPMEAGPGVPMPKKAVPIEAVPDEAEEDEQMWEPAEVAVTHTEPKNVVSPGRAICGESGKDATRCTKSGNSEGSARWPPLPTGKAQAVTAGEKEGGDTGPTDGNNIPLAAGGGDFMQAVQQIQSQLHQLMQSHQQAQGGHSQLSSANQAIASTGRVIPQATVVQRAQPVPGGGMRPPNLANLNPQQQRERTAEWLYPQIRERVRGESEACQYTMLVVDQMDPMSIIHKMAAPNGAALLIQQAQRHMAAGSGGWRGGPIQALTTLPPALQTEKLKEMLRPSIQQLLQEWGVGPERAAPMVDLMVTQEPHRAVKALESPQERAQLLQQAMQFTQQRAPQVARMVVPPIGTATRIIPTSIPMAGMHTASGNPPPTVVPKAPPPAAGNTNQMDVDPAPEKPQSKWPQSESRYKTTVCWYFQRNQCRNGAACTFAHGQGELKPKTVARGDWHPPPPTTLQMWAGVSKGGKGGKGSVEETTKGKGKGKGKGSGSPDGMSPELPSQDKRSGEPQQAREGAEEKAERRPVPAPKKKMGLRWLTREQFTHHMAETAPEGMSAEQAWKKSMEALQAAGVGNQSNKPYQVARMKLSAQLKENLEHMRIPTITETGKPERKQGHDGKIWSKQEYIDYWALAPHGKGPLELREVMRRWQEAEPHNDATKTREPAEYLAVAFCLATADVTFRHGRQSGRVAVPTPANHDPKGPEKGEEKTKQMLHCQLVAEKEMLHEIRRLVQHRRSTGDVAYQEAQPITVREEDMLGQLLHKQCYVAANACADSQSMAAPQFRKFLLEHCSESGGRDQLEAQLDKIGVAENTRQNTKEKEAGEAHVIAMAKEKVERCKGEWEQLYSTAGKARNTGERAKAATAAAAAATQLQKAMEELENLLGADYHLSIQELNQCVLCATCNALAPWEHPETHPTKEDMENFSRAIEVMADKKPGSMSSPLGDWHYEALKNAIQHRLPMYRLQNQSRPRSDPTHWEQLPAAVVHEGSKMHGHAICVRQTPRGDLERVDSLPPHHLARPTVDPTFLTAPPVPENCWRLERLRPEAMKNAPESLVRNVAQALGLPTEEAHRDVAGQVQLLRDWAEEQLGNRYHMSRQKEAERRTADLLTNINKLMQKRDGRERDTTGGQDRGGAEGNASAPANTWAAEHQKTLE